MKMFFITGFPRSGTTLSERILGNQNNTFVAHHLFPTLFLNVKKEYLKSNGIVRNYPFLADIDDVEQNHFTNFLKNTSFTASQVRKWMLEGRAYPGMGEKKMLDKLPNIEGDLISIVRFFLNYLSSKSNNYLGFKDVLMDEFIPYFKDSGVRSILIVRDPRAVIYSLINSQEMGKYRPTLFNLKVWKRGISRAQKSESLVIKYEDLVQDFESERKRLSSYLRFDVQKEIFPLRQNNGELWLSNSSFDRGVSLSRNSLNLYEKNLSKEAISYIETICFVEMRELGYKIALPRALPINALKEPFKVTHRLFSDWDNEAELEMNKSDSG